MVCGGGWSYKTCHSYSPGTRQWELDAALDRSRLFATSVLLSPREWWIAGGQDEKHVDLDTSVVFNGVDFLPGPQLPYRAERACSCQVNQTQLFLPVDLTVWLTVRMPTFWSGGIRGGYGWKT